MGGATVKGSFNLGGGTSYLGLSVVEYSLSSAARLLVTQRCLFLAVRNIPTLLFPVLAGHPCSAVAHSSPETTKMRIAPKLRNRISVLRVLEQTRLYNY